MSCTTGELIEFLKKFPEDMPIAYQCFSEYVALDIIEIEVKDACEERGDGWVPKMRPDKSFTTYLLFPGN